jgi:allantoin racemase
VKILYINPVGYEGFNQDTFRILQAAKNNRTQVELVSLPPDRPRHVQYHAYEALVLADIVRIVYQQSQQYDAFVIGCFYDIGLREAREVSGKAIVTAPCEASASIAAKLGNTFSILVSSTKNIPRMQENVHRYGYGQHLASMRAVNIGILDLQRDPDFTCERMLAEGRKAVEQDRAEVLILGCAAIYGFYETMQAELGVPVIDAALAPFKYAEFLTDLSARFGWRPSRKHGSEPPPEAEIEAWNLFAQPFSPGATIKAEDQ